MANKNWKNTLFILESTGVSDTQSFLQSDMDIHDIHISQQKSNTIIYINPNFYVNNKLYIHNIIVEHYPTIASNIVLSNTEYLKHISTILSDMTNKPNIHFNKSCDISIDMFKDIDLNHFGSFTFEENVPYAIATELLKKNIVFHTTTTYPLLDRDKFITNNNLITQSDYYQSLILSINGAVSEDDITALNIFFDMNKILYNITLNTDIRSALHVIKTYVSNISKYSHATFDLHLTNIILNKSENKCLYEIHKLLMDNKCKLNLVTPTKEVITFENYTSTLAPLRKFANKINSLNLSPLEKLILIEDFSKSKPYYDSYNKSTSRKFFSSRNSDHIVCYTYADTFKALCDYADIPCAISVGRLTTDGGKVSEHAKIICNIDDNKYDKRGLYIFEPTFDAMQVVSDFNEEQACDNYLYFATTFEEYKDSHTISTTEYGILSNETDSTNQAECIKQLHSLYSAEFILEHGIDHAISIAQSVLAHSEPIDLDTFKGVLSSARNSIDSFTNDDMDRIVRINSARAAQLISRLSTNRFIDNNLLDMDSSTIFDFDEL